MNCEHVLALTLTQTHIHALTHTHTPLIKFEGYQHAFRFYVNKKNKAKDKEM